jgi:hypothetical protein
MSFTVKANCQHGSQLIHRRKSPEAGLKKARELLKICYEVHIITPEGRDYASSEFGDIPRTSRALQPVRKTPLAFGRKYRRSPVSGNRKASSTAWCESASAIQKNNEYDPAGHWWDARAPVAPLGDIPGATLT